MAFHTKPVALVTGASSGIGRELVCILARDGYDCVVVARRKERLAELKLELEEAYTVRIIPIIADLLDPDSPDHIKKLTDDLGLKIDVLVNDAGFGAFGDFIDVPWEDIAGQVSVNVLALMHLTKLFLPEMVAQKHGKILNVGSVAGYSPGPHSQVYYATKAFVVSYSEALWAETQGTGVTVTCLNPGLTRTEFHDVAGGPKPKLGWMSAQKVAAIGYKAMVDGRRVVAAGWLNAFAVWIIRFVPRRFLFKFL